MNVENEIDNLISVYYKLRLISEIEVNKNLSLKDESTLYNQILSEVGEKLDPIDQYFWLTAQIENIREGLI